MTPIPPSAPVSGLYTQPGRLIRVVTHPTPDLDALASAWGLVYILGSQAWLSFTATPEPGDHDPASYRFVVDIGGGPLDHHHPRPDGSSVADRSTCAFVLVCEYGQGHPDPEVQARATALLTHVAPAVLRQDSTGSIASPPDPVAATLGLPHLIAALHGRLRDDLAVADAVKPWLTVIFDAAVARHAAETRALSALPEAVTQPAPGLLTLVATSRDGDLDRLMDVAWLAYPEAQVMAYVITHTDAAGDVITVSRGLGRRDDATISITSLVASLRSLPLDPAVAAELGRWHVEDWFAGRGSRKRPATDAPPEALITELVRWLPGLIAEA